MKKTIISSIIILLSFSVNAQSWWSNKRVRGNGHMVTKTRKTSDYDAISVGGSFNVKLVKGREGNIRIYGEENIIKYLVTEVSGNTLKVRYKKNVSIRTTRRLTVTIPYEDIDKIALGGSGNISSNHVIKATNMSISLGGSGDINLQIDATNIRTSIGGSGNINLSGNTDELSCSIAGSGSIRAYDLRAKSVDAKIAGSGNIKTTVKDAINAKVVGSGNIYYKGNPPRIKSKSVGSGNVIDRN